jgi:heme exporter protein C
MAWKVTLFILLSLVLVAGISFPIVHNPTEWYQFPFIQGLGQNAKIVFFHVPTAWVTVIAFLTSTIYSIKFLVKRNLEDDARSYSAAQLGITFCVLATVTGAVWAKFAWGSFWSWDPRQTSIFALLMIYGAWFALRSSIEAEDKKALLSSVYSVIAFITVPFFIFIMPRIMNGLHPGSANDTNSGPIVDFKMNANMLVIFYLSLIGFTILFFWMWRLGYKSIIYKNKLEHKLISG